MPAQVRESVTSRELSLPWWVRICRVLWKVTAILGTTVILGTIASLIGTWLTSPNGVIPTSTPLRQLISLWPITLPLGGCFLLLALVIWIVSRWPLLISSRPQRNRALMLGQLRNTYDTILKKTLGQNAWMDATLSERHDVEENTETFLLRVGNQPESLLPAGTSILDVYDQGARGLLILGEPGTGKSTQLLKLAQKLVKRAESDAEHPLPVILPLSSWVSKRSSLQDWMIGKLVEIYRIPLQVSEQWVREGTILPLLDGLDEMDEAARPTRIAEINRYYQGHLVPLVVCSRTAAYEAAAQHKRLALQRAVVVQPLTNQQVDVYLVQAGKPVAALRSAIKKNPALQKLATTPLMLSVLMRAYHGTIVRELPKKQALLQQEVWRDYITQMVQRKGNKTRYPLEQTYRWLIYLAQQLRAHQQPIFYVEQLQSDWLPNQRRALYLYKWSVGLIIGLAAGLVSGLGLGLIFGYNTEIKPIEVLTWPWKNLKSGLVLGLSPLLFIALAVELGIVNVYLARLGDTLIIILSIVLAAMVNRGFSGEQLPAREELSPNEGIRRSLKHGLLILVARLGCGFLFGLGFALALGPGFGLIVGLGFGLGFGLFMGLLAGLGAALQHYILRFWLWRTHTFPFKVVPFLEDATNRILLSRKFGGYSFSHQLLQDYFADLSLAKASVMSTTPPPTGDPSA